MMDAERLMLDCAPTRIGYEHLAGQVASVQSRQAKEEKAVLLPGARDL